jgi:hypothetical protein
MLAYCGPAPFCLQQVEQLYIASGDFPLVAQQQLQSRAATAKTVFDTV